MFWHAAAAAVSHTKGDSPGSHKANFDGKTHLGDLSDASKVRLAEPVFAEAGDIGSYNCAIIVFFLFLSHSRLAAHAQSKTPNCLSYVLRFCIFTRMFV